MPNVLGHPAAGRKPDSTKDVIAVGCAVLLGFLLFVGAGDAAVAHATPRRVPPHALPAFAHGKLFDLTSITGQSITKHGVDPKLVIPGTPSGAIPSARGSLLQVELNRGLAAKRRYAIADTDGNVDLFKIGELLKQPIGI